MNLRLAELRKKARLTQNEAAKKIGVSAKTLWNWEKGDTIPDCEQLWNCAVVLNCTPNDILGWHEENPSSEQGEALTVEEREIVDCYRESTPQWQQNISMTARAASGESKKKTESDIPSTTERKAV